MGLSGAVMHKTETAKCGSEGILAAARNVRNMQQIPSPKLLLLFLFVTAALIAVD